MSGLKFDRSQWPEILEELRSEDPLTYEGAFYYVLSEVEAIKDLLIEALVGEESGRMRNRFIELLGECRDEGLLDLFKKELNSGDAEVIPWALSAIEKLQSKDASQIASEFRRAHPEWD